MDKLKFYRHQERKNKLQRLFLMLSAGILCFALTGQAFADCGYTRRYITEGYTKPLPAVWRDRVRNSSDAALSDAFRANNGSCFYKKGPHPDRRGIHVTVGIHNDATCHVYEQIILVNGFRRNRTTCW